MKWLKNHTKAAVIALIVFVLGGFCVASYLSIGSDTWLGRTAETAVQWVQKPLTAAGEGVKNGFKGLFRFRALQEENTELQERIDQLEAELRENKLFESDLRELRALKDFLNENSLDEYPHVTTKITALDNSNWFTTLTIGAGTNDGVSENDVVVSSEGLVGRVLETGPNWSKVICIIHDNSNVSFKVLDDLETVGILSGAGDGTLKGYLLSTSATVSVGDELITSGMELYPEGIAIGKVLTKEKDPDSHLTYVTVEPASSFQTVQTVTVIQTK